jgi:hypothetical protein
VAICAGLLSLCGLARGEDRVAAARFGGGVRGGFLEEPRDHDGDHLDVGELFGTDVEVEVFVLAGHAAVPALEQVPHRDGHLAVGAAEQ